jgi:ribosomal protein S18 acetylase RimI-like enzyme
LPLEIRPADPAELPDIADLCVAAYAPFLVDKDHYVAVLRDVARRAAEAELLVAAEPDGGVVLGTVTFVPDGGALGEIGGPGEAEFRMLAVDPAAQRRGVGIALLRRVLDDSRRAGKEGVVCSSLPVMRAAHRIYAHVGFERVPERDWSPVPGVELLAFAISFDRPHGQSPRG